MAENSFSDISFEELSLNSSLQRAVRELGFEMMTPIQAQAIPVLLEGRDVIGQAQTGTGKTAAFGLPILQMVDPENKDLQAVILCPTRELAVQAANELRNFAKFMHDVKVLPVYGGQDITRQIKGLKGVQIIVGTPGRVMDHMRRHTIRMDSVSMVVLDEADEMLNMGFREDMEVILGAIDHPHQTCLFSATMPQPILDLTHLYQKDPEFIKITQEELTLENIHQYYYAVKREYKTLALVRLLNFYRYHRCVIFCNTKSMVDELATHLQDEGFTAEGLHGDLTQKQRDFVMGRFRNGTLNCLIATDIAARGIDVDNVEAVFNYDLPQETEYYVHRIGRTGRAGKEGTSHTLCRSRDFNKIHEIEEVCHSTMEERKIPTPAQIRDSKELAVLDQVTEVLTGGRSGRLIPAVRRYCTEHDLPPEAFAAAFYYMEIGEDTYCDDDEIEVDLPSKREGRRFRGDREDYERCGGRRDHRSRNHNTEEEFGEDFEKHSRRFHTDEEKSDRDDKPSRRFQDKNTDSSDNESKRFRRSRIDSADNFDNEDRRSHRSKSENADSYDNGGKQSRRSKTECSDASDRDARRSRDKDSRRDREDRNSRRQNSDSKSSHLRKKDDRRSRRRNPDAPCSDESPREVRARNKERSRRILSKSMKDLRMNGQPFKKHHG